MKVNCDGSLIEITERFEKALIGVLKAERAMMGKQDGKQTDWYWGRATVYNLSEANGVEFTYGDKASMPKDRRGRFAVVRGIC